MRGIFAACCPRAAASGHAAAAPPSAAKNFRQYVTTDFPVLSAGPTPQIKLGDWAFALQLGASLLGKWNWAEFEARSLRLRSRRIFTASPNFRNSIRPGKARDI